MFFEIIKKVIDFIFGGRLKFELDEYKSNFSFMLDLLVRSLKNDTKSSDIVIDGLVELKDKNNDLLDKLFTSWQNKQKQLLYICLSLLIISILLICSHMMDMMDFGAQLLSTIFSAFLKIL